MEREKILEQEKSGEELAKDRLKVLEQQFIKAMSLGEPECYAVRKPIDKEIEKILEVYPQLQEYYDTL